MFDKSLESYRKYFRTLYNTTLRNRHIFDMSLIYLIVHNIFKTPEKIYMSKQKKKVKDVVEKK